MANQDRNQQGSEQSRNDISGRNEPGSTSQGRSEQGNMGQSGGSRSGFRGRSDQSSRNSDLDSEEEGLTGSEDDRDRGGEDEY